MKNIYYFLYFPRLKTLNIYQLIFFIFMNKAFVILFLIICFNYVTPFCESDDDDASKNVCNSKELSAEEKEKDEEIGQTPDSCCYIESSEGKGCGAYEKKKVPDFVKEYKKKDSKLSIDCASSYINLIKFSLIFLLLLN